MPATRTAEELRAAVDSMFRIRAVESPPDATSGLRKVWHRGALHAELISEIDLSGEVARHEFSLFDDVVVWERDKGFHTGTATAEGVKSGAQNVAFDGAIDPGRMTRVVAALQPYTGRDRIILHLRDLVVATQAGAKPVRSLGVVTGSKLAVAPPPPVVVLPAPPPKSRAALWIGLGVALIAVALGALLLK